MTRYLVFAGAAYYPMGGWGDFVAGFDSYEEACNRMQAEFSEYSYSCDPWGEVVDTKHGEVVKRLGRTPTDD